MYSIVFLIALVLTSHRLRSLSAMLMNPDEDVQEKNLELIETFIFTLMGGCMVCVVGYM